MAEVLVFLFSSPLQSTLALVGVICIGLAIIGKVPSFEIQPPRSYILAGFGCVLLLLSLISSAILSGSSQNNSGNGVNVSATSATAPTGLPINSIPSTKTSGVNVDIPIPTNSATNSLATPEIDSSIRETQTSTIPMDGAASFFEGEVVVAIADYSWINDSISLVIASAGYPSKKEINVRSGNAVEYDGKQKYSVVVANISPKSAVVFVNATIPK